MSILPHWRGDSPLPQCAGIYAITHIPSGNSYIGSAVNFRTRQKQHQNKLQMGVHPNRHLQNAWNKYGSTTFLFRLLDYSDDLNELVVTEQQWIDTTRPIYNIRRIARSNLGLTFKGYKRSLADRQRMSAQQKGRKHTPESRAKISAAGMGRTFSDATKEKRRLTRNLPERRAAISAGLRTAWSTYRTPQALAAKASLEHGDTMLSIRDAAQSLRCSAASIRNFIHGGTLPATKVGKFWIIDSIDLEYARASLLTRLNRVPSKRISRSSPLKGRSSRQANPSASQS